MPKITYKNTGAVAILEDGANLKVAIEDEGWPVPMGCEDGLCGTCIIQVAEGMENLSEMEEKEKITLDAMGLLESGHRLACQCDVHGDVVIETM